MSTETLSSREQEYLAHLQRVEELGVSLREYADAYGLEVKDLYNGKRQLKKKGLLHEATGGAADFVAVRIADTAGTPVCRLRHPSGGVLECSDWPPAAWLSAVLSGGNDAAG